MRFALLLLCLSSPLALSADTPTSEEKAAMDFVMRSGGTATYDSRFAPGARVSARFPMLTDAILNGLKKFHPQIGGIESFDTSRCTEKGWITLKDIPDLRKLMIPKANLSKASLAALGECKEMRQLGLHECNLTDVTLENLKSLKNLEQLTLSNNSRITDKGMAVVKGFERLRVLHLDNTSLTNRGLEELKGLDGLRNLSVAGTSVTSDAAEKFADQMPNLRVVRR